MYIFEETHIKFLTFYYFLILASCVWPVLPRNVAALRKSKPCLNAYHCTVFWRNFVMMMMMKLVKLWPLNEHHIMCFLSHISNNCIIRNNPQKIEKTLMSNVISRESPWGGDHRGIHVYSGIQFWVSIGSIYVTLIMAEDALKRWFLSLIFLVLCISKSFLIKTENCFADSGGGDSGGGGKITMFN